MAVPESSYAGAVGECAGPASGPRELHDMGRHADVARVRAPGAPHAAVAQSTLQSHLEACARPAWTDRRKITALGDRRLRDPCRGTRHRLGTTVRVLALGRTAAVGD